MNAVNQGRKSRGGVGWEATLNQEDSPYSLTVAVHGHQQLILPLFLFHVLQQKQDIPTI